MNHQLVPSAPLSFAMTKSSQTTNKQCRTMALRDSATAASLKAVVHNA